MYDNEYGYVNVTPNETNNYGGNVPDNKPPKKSGKGKMIAAILALILGGGLIGGGVAYGVLSAQGNVKTANEAQEESIWDQIIESQEEQAAQAQTEDVAPPVEEKTNNLPTTSSEGEMSVAEIAKKGLPSIVAITNMSEREVRSMWGNYTQQSKSAGSGIIIAQTDQELLILTNYHVVEGNSTLSVVFSYEEGKNDESADVINAVIKDYDEDRDIAVIAIKMSDLSAETLNSIAVATIGSSNDLVLGEQVVAIGNALGYGQSVTTGIVSALNRHMGTAEEYSAGTIDQNTFIQTDAAINPGNSGGALFNMKGELVGVNSAKIGGSTVEGMGYAIPISDIMGNVETMMLQETRSEVPEGERGYLGVSIVDVTSEIHQVYGLPIGIYVSAVHPGSGAEAAGIQKEEIITAVNGKKVDTSNELKGYLAYFRYGETVTVTVAYRSDEGYSYRDVDVVLSDGDTAGIAAPETTPVEEEQSGQNGTYSFTLPFGR